MYDSAGNLDKAHLVELYAPLVKRIAYQMMAKLPASVDVDDLMQNGMIGLLDAIGRYEEGAAQFETYAAQRVRGAMLDALRENDWMPRGLRRDMRRIERAVHTLEQRLGRAPSEQELADALDLSLADYQRALQDARGHQLVYFEDFAPDEDGDFFERHVTDEAADPLAMIEDADLRRMLVEAIAALPEREQLIMSLYYDKDLNLREIGAVLGVTESRVCQLHSQAVARLRAHVFGDAAPRPAARRRGRPPRAKA
ncbi:MAG TPA: RNA polymerase sigma factor FliA [Azoarcus sp.]|nr:RNA polymerase sigma factor FliA [Azoarcus sp.]